MTIENLKDKLVEVGTTQTTFVQLKEGGQSYRVNYISKKEFCLKMGTSGVLRYYEEHPLLIDHNEYFVSTYINSKADNVDFIANEVKSLIEKITSGWRNWVDYLVIRNTQGSLKIFLDNLRTGTGKILEAPSTITSQVVALLNQYSIATKTFDDLDDAVKQENKLFFIGNNYVIAQDFKVVKELNPNL